MQLNPELRREFDNFRGSSQKRSVCPAPQFNLHFSQLGVVSACCFNRSHILGVYPKNSIQEIWEGLAAQELREHLAVGDFSKGCAKCFQQIQAGDFEGSHAAFYTRQSARLLKHREGSQASPQDNDLTNPFPLKIEFNVHNTCNLQCIMCHGLASSSVRKHREGLDTMPNPYDESFAEQLIPFIPHLVESDFIGGEPFLLPVYQRIWQLIGELNNKTKVFILTNATVLNPKIKRILESTNCELHVSIDSIVKTTYETIRRGASYEEVMANCEYFKGLMAERGLPMVWRYCPMRINWHEIPDTLSYCNEQGIELFFNQVDSPIGLSLTTLPVDKLEKVVKFLEEKEPRLAPNLVSNANLDSYRGLVARLQGFLYPKNRVAGLRSRLVTSEAVVRGYTRLQEGEIQQSEVSSLENDLVRATKHYLITRLNVELYAAKDELDLMSLREYLEKAEFQLGKLRERVDLAQFLRIYFKELVRTYSGVWGVVEIHDERVFEHIDLMISKHKIIDGILDSNYSNRITQVSLHKLYKSLIKISLDKPCKDFLEALVY